MLSKKENALRKHVKQAIASVRDSNLHVSWIESHSTSIGVPDLNYSYYGVEGWLELKCGPEIEIRAAQKIWIEERIEAGGFPLFLIQYGDTYIIAPGSAAAGLRAEPHEENVRRHATALWEGKINPEQFLKVLKNPRKYYGQKS